MLHFQWFNLDDFAIITQNLPILMKKILFSILTMAVFTGCSLLSPYSITFTTQDSKVINPETDTLDLVISQPALAYISGVSCDENPPMELLPILDDTKQVAQAHNLDLSLLADQERGSKCTVTVTAFDKTTTSNSNKSISLYVLERREIVDEEVIEDVVEGQEEITTTDESTTTSEDSSGEESNT